MSKLMIIIIASFAFPLPVLADDWYVETVDNTGDAGEYTSIILDSQNQPHISYYGSSSDDLKYAKRTGSGWEIEIIDSVGNVGKYTSIALDGQGYPHISYYHAASGYDLKYAHWNGTQWEIEIVDSTGNVGWYTSIELDSQDHPHISYYAANPYYSLKYATWTGSNWNIATVDSAADVGLWSSIALDGQDYPHISYRDEDNTDLKYAKWTGSSWEIETVDSDGNKGEYTSLALDSQDRPHIAYLFEYYIYIFSYHDLRYARWTGSSWDLQTVDDPYYLSLGEWTSLALDDQDRAHISCYEGGSQRDLKYCKWTGSAWNSTTPDSTGDVGTFTSIALDNDDNPHISYYDATNRDLKYAYYGSVGIEDEDTPNTPAGFFLAAPVPNPSSGLLTITFALPRACKIDLTLYDIKGRKVATLTEGEYAPGEYKIPVSGLSSGVYLYKLEAEEFSDVKKMVVR